MSFEVPPHVRPIRAKVRRFVEERIYPAEAVLDRGDDEAHATLARLLTLDAAHKIDAGDPARVEIGLIKVVGAAMVHNAIDRAIQVYGAKGLTPDTPLERMYRHARFARIYDGPDEVHRATVARLLLRSYGSGGRYDFGGAS